ncbi:hypothetical protein ACHAXS_009218 [Conticribra weissflogii]
MDFSYKSIAWEKSPSSLSLSAASRPASAWLIDSMYAEEDGDILFRGMKSRGLFNEDVGVKAGDFVISDFIVMPIRMLSACIRSYFSRRDLSENADGCAVDMVGAVEVWYCLCLFGRRRCV